MKSSIQKLILTLCLVVAFWHGLFAGVPRSDQIIYLNGVTQFKNFWDIISHSLFWNRNIQLNLDDALLFRPVLYILLGTLYFVFKYNFILWQLTSLSLHIFVVLGLHTLLSLGKLKKSPFPFLLSLFFGTSLLGSELVLWNHIVGYLLFSLLSILTILLLISFFNTQKHHYIYLALLFAFAAEFTYESAVFINILIALQQFQTSSTLLFIILCIF